MDEHENTPVASDPKTHAERAVEIAREVVPPRFAVPDLPHLLTDLAPIYALGRSIEATRVGHGVPVVLLPEGYHDGLARFCGYDVFHVAGLPGPMIGLRP